MSSLAGMEPVDFLARHVTVTSSRRQLYDKVRSRNVLILMSLIPFIQVFTRNRSTRDGLLTEEVSEAQITN